MHRVNGRRSGRTAAVCGLAALLCLGLGGVAPGAPEPATTTGTVHSVTLTRREQPGMAVATTSLPFFAETTPFKKEPAWDQRKVVRGLLKFGNRTDQFLPMVWDYTQRKLYLDLNRNQDLTDDGVLTAGYGNNSGTRYYYQTFTNISLSFKTPMGEHRVLVDFNLYNYNNQPNGSASLHSFWDGKITLGGKDWQIGLVEAGSLADRIGSPDKGYLLLRPWGERQQPVAMEDGALKGFPFCRHLFFGRQAYQVDCTYLQQGGAPGYRLDLMERPAELGELKLSGQFIQRLVLKAEHPGNTSMVVLDTPRAVERVPVGHYEAQVHLQHGTASASPSNGRPFQSPPGVAVSASEPATLAIGGPLTNTVAVTRHGRDLYLSYSLVGAGGATYQLDGPRANPRFVAYQGGKKVGSGKFEFG